MMQCKYYKHIYRQINRQIQIQIYKGRSQNLKEVPQNFMEVFNVDDVTTNDIIQKNQHR